MKHLYRTMLLLCLLAFSATGVKAAGWPAGFQGVMLQAFYWDSYTDTKWTNLTSQADELSQYFKLIWVPNSGKAATNGMGYDAVYWFTNHNSRFGTESQVRTMINTFKEKGTGIIADVVLNHRSGKSNWTDFPAETWNGVTWKIGPEGICCDDEVAGQPGQATPTGAPDTGEHFDGSRDLDHTNANVQNNCKNFCKFLLQDMGYAGFRLDMVKGYRGEFTKIYNQYANPTYSVGEYWDGSYDALAGWVESTGKTSAVFDYAFKYAVNEAFGGNDMTKLVWMANWTTPQPAGLIHFAYQQYAVTFIENHDTDGNGTNAFSGNVLAANAFMICSPGTPCVFLKHWKQYKEQIKKLIEVRNKVGVSNTSSVTVLKSTRDCYMAEVVGTKGKLVVKVGSAQDSPAGYSNSQIYCSGNGYCVWSTASGGTGGGGGGGDDPNPGSYPATLYLQGNVNGCAWSTSDAVAATGSNGKYTYNNVTVNDSGDGSGYFSFATTLGADWDVVNSGDRYGSAQKDEPIAKGGTSSITAYPAGVSSSGCQSWMIAPGKYTIIADLASMTLRITDSEGGSGGDDPGPGPNPGTYPTKLYMQGNVNGCDWSTSDAVGVSGVNGVYSYNNVTIDDAGEGSGYFSFATMLGEDWDVVNSGDRYGSADTDQPIAAGETSAITPYPANVSAMGCQSWMIPAGVYNIIADLSKMMLEVKSASGIDNLATDTNVTARYYNLMGIEVAHPTQGIYIVRRGDKVTKEYIK